jgi:hypothetical protein
LSFLPFKLGAKRRMSLGQERTHGADLDSHHAGDLRVREVAVVPKNDAVALTRRKPSQRTVEGAADGGGRLYVPLEEPKQSSGETLTANAPALGISSSIEHEAPEPGLERSFPPPGRPRAEGARKRLLDDVACGVRPRDRRRKPSKARRLRTVDRLDRGG